MIGVAPEDFHGTITGLRFDLFVPLTMQASLTGGSQWLTNRGARPLYLFARLKPGVTIERARDEAGVDCGRARARVSRSNRSISATLLPLAQARRGAQQALGPLLKILMARRRDRAADRLRERRQPAARARDGASARDRRPARPRRDAARGSCSRCSPKGLVLGADCRRARRADERAGSSTR